jgi:hypothetical protein
MLHGVGGLLCNDNVGLITDLTFAPGEECRDNRKIDVVQLTYLGRQLERTCSTFKKFHMDNSRVAFSGVHVEGTTLVVSRKISKTKCSISSMHTIKLMSSY